VAKHISHCLWVIVMNRKGFTLIETVVVLAILAILSAVAVPAFISWLPDYRLKGSSRDIYGAMSKARSSAARQNTVAVMTFSLPNDTYTVFLDNGPGAAAGNWALDATETIIATGSMGDGIDMYGSTLNGVGSIPPNTYGYNAMGLPQTPLTGPYEVHLKNSNNKYMGVRVNAAGTLSIITSTDGGVNWN